MSVKHTKVVTVVNKLRQKQIIFFVVAIVKQSPKGVKI